MNIRFLSGCHSYGFYQVYDALVGSVEKYGIRGLKGFFYAIYKKDDVTLEGRSVALDTLSLKFSYVYFIVGFVIKSSLCSKSTDWEYPAHKIL